MSLMDHVMNIVGNCPPIKIMPKMGWTIVKVEWEGCMATNRVEVDIGDILGYGIQKLVGSFDPVPGIWIEYDKRGTRWEPLDRLRVVNGAAEIWS